MDFRTLSIDDFHTWLKILEMPFAENSKAFNDHKSKYQKDWSDYQKRIKLSKSQEERIGNNNDVPIMEREKNYLGAKQIIRIENEFLLNELRKYCGLEYVEIEDSSDLIDANSKKKEGIKLIQSCNIELLEELKQIIQEYNEILQAKILVLEKKCDIYATENTKLKERCKIFDESNF
jgi:hypothetical protein